MNEPLTTKLYQNGQQKKNLCLDGGGIRGTLSLGILKKIESVLRKETQSQSLVLSDYFDLICGTSTVLHKE